MSNTNDVMNLNPTGPTLLDLNSHRWEIVKFLKDVVQKKVPDVVH